jgi:hypothetical protein
MRAAPEILSGSEPVVRITGRFSFCVMLSKLSGNPQEEKRSGACA